MERIQEFFKYIGYAASAFFLGWFSSLGGPENDYLYKISGAIIPILLTLLALSTTMTSLLCNELCKFANKHKTDTIPVIKDCKRSIFIELGIICFALLLFISKGAMTNYESIFSYYIVLSNAVTVFAIFYFMLIIADNATGLFDLISHNNMVD